MKIVDLPIDKNREKDSLAIKTVNKFTHQLCEYFSILRFFFSCSSCLY